jgi:hypothetical protein
MNHWHLVSALIFATFLSLVPSELPLKQGTDEGILLLKSLLWLSSYLDTVSKTMALCGLAHESHV